MNKEALEKSIGYHFGNPELLQEAMTHASAVYENPGRFPNSNQRLEFLGDSVLNLAVGSYLYTIRGNSGEGSLSKLRSLVVCENSLAEVAGEFHINRYLEMGKNDAAMGVDRNPSVMADAMEALIGAIFIDGGYARAQEFVMFAFAKVIEKALAGDISTDYKTRIQEILQKDGEVTIEYTIDRQEGPPHDRTFYASLWFAGEKLGTGAGKTKKEAEQRAAKAALEVKSVL